MTENIHPSISELAEGSVLLFDKPFGWTSFDVVGKARSLLRRRLGLKNTRVGHAGTLDPLATGLLIVCTGKMTKSIDQFQAMEKEYTGTFLLGQTTPSYDLETSPDQHYPTQHISRTMVDKACDELTGTFEQIPPLFSAKKVDGERAYEIARRGEKRTLRSREVTVFEFAVSRYEMPEVDFRVVCSKGTYIRSLARDFGVALASGAYLKALRRTRIGLFEVDRAWQIDAFENHIHQLQH